MAAEVRRACLVHPPGFPVEVRDRLVKTIETHVGRMDEWRFQADPQMVGTRLSVHAEPVAVLD